MSDENKTNLPGEQPAETGPDSALNEEMENVRQIFQNELDKAAAAAQAPEGPVIQELDDDGSADDEDEEDGDSADAAKPAETKKARKAAKEKKKRPVGLIVALVLVIVVLVVPLSAYFVMSVREPNLNAFLSAVALAEKAEDPAEKVSKLTEALAFCTEGSVFEGQKQTLTEKCVVATAEANGYAAAVSYMNANTTEEMRDSPKTRDFKNFLGVADKLAPLFDGALERVTATADAAGGAEAVDYEALAKELGAPDLVLSEVADVLKSLGEAAEAEKTAADDDSFYEAMGKYITAQQAITAMNVTSSAIPAMAARKLMENGYAYEASLILQNYVSEEGAADGAGETAAAVHAELEAIAASGADPFTLAETLSADGAPDAAAIEKALPASLAAGAKTSLAKLVSGICEGLAAANGKNLTLAKAKLGESLTRAAGMNLPVEKLAIRTAEVYLASGDPSNAYSITMTHLVKTADTADGGTEAAEGASGEGADDSAKQDAELKALFGKYPAFEATYNTLNSLYQAQTASNDVVSNAYYSVMYSGGSFDAAATKTALDELTKENADNWTLAYVNYYKFICERLANGEYSDMLGYLNAAEAAFGEYAIICASDKAQLLLDMKDAAAAEAAARQILAADAGSDVAHAVLAKCSRVAGDAAKAKQYAEEGVSLAGKAGADSCKPELLIAALLEGDYRTAYQLGSEILETKTAAQTLTREDAALVYAAAALYKSESETEQKEVDAAKEKVEGLFTQSGVEIPEGAAAVANGTKTPAEVWLGADAE